MKKLLLLIPVLLAACSGQGFQVTNPFEGADIGGATVTMQLENGQQVVFSLNSKSAQLNEFTRVLIERGYYNDQYIYRDVPGAFVLTGKARLSGRPTMAGPYIAEAEKYPAVGSGQVGLVVHVDGTVGPEFILRYGSMIRDKETQPANIVIGRIKEGEDALENAQKGDKVLKVTVQR